MNFSLLYSPNWEPFPCIFEGEGIKEQIMQDFKAPPLFKHRVIKRRKKRMLSFCLYSSVFHKTSEIPYNAWKYIQIYSKQGKIQVRVNGHNLGKGKMQICSPKHPTQILKLV